MVPIAERPQGVLGGEAAADLLALLIAQVPAA
jgi:hypothetical protein